MQQHDMNSYDSSTTGINVSEFIDGRPESRDWNYFLAHCKDAECLFRVDISSRDPASLRGLVNAIHQNPLVLERCLDPDTVSGVHTYDDMLALQLPFAEDWEASAHPKLTVFCLANTVVTVRIFTAARGGPDLQVRPAVPASRVTDVEGLLFSLLDTIIDRSSELTLLARRSVDQLETDLQQVTDEAEIGRRILYLKRSAAHFEMALEAKHRTLMALLSQDTGLLDLHRIREPLHDVVAHVEHSLRYIERAEDHLSELDRHFLLLMQDRTNNRLRILTIVSAIFMPLTLIAGIYGMNFHFMPELSWHYGYFAVLVLMLSLALGLIWYFYRKGWFR